ncbi:MAG: Asp-tRNA(Asn)/Glu-tRNA(Gln) amidotransferase subunit GatB [Polyangia bacterium]|jgi:aspartyl-tRNA(Asn)/glutamyl-tRNA(Gln) amidotransferase subunit B
MSREHYQAVIGLEVHVQLATRTKIFSSSAAAFGGEPNQYTDPTCLGLPGALPVLNREAVDAAVRLGLACGSRIRSRCRFARKHYFYPDLPKGFQISQYDEPLCEGGRVSFRLHGKPHQVRLTRIHMEDDAGKNVHDPSGVSFVDFNRAGVPLCEIVSEPDLRSAEEAAEYVRAIRTLVRYLGISDGNMEEGSLRCDANVSLRRSEASELGTKTELKNINSFKHVRDAIEHEITRQALLLDRGEVITQETRLWDPDRGVSAAMRSKEQAHDYRYFPEPDLPPVAVDEAWQEQARNALPELPEARYARYTDMGLPAQDTAVLVAERAIGDYFDQARAVAPEAKKKIANWLINEVLARVEDTRQLMDPAIPVPPAALAELVVLVEQGTLSGKMGKEVFARMWQERRSAADIVATEAVAVLSDRPALEQACARALAASPDEVARYRAGNLKLLGFFVGKVMKETGGKADPRVVNEILGKLLG